jgi:hypothetical protein
MHTIRTALLAVLLGFAVPSSAQPCSGFTDVDAGSQFCPNVDWLKNRSITLGCTSATLYCPNDPVSRLSMAAFMNRLGNALTPITVRVEESGAAVDLSTSPNVCETADQVITGFPRSFMIWGTITAKGAPDGDVLVQVVRSVNGGAFAPTNQQGRNFSLRNPVWNGTSVMSSPQPGPQANLDVNSTYRFALRILRSASTSNITSYHCHLIVELRSRQGATFPHDPN